MKNIVITGSTRGIGRSLALDFLKAGCSVWISSRHLKAVKESIMELKTLSGNDEVNGLVCDVTIFKDLTELWKRASENHPVNVWINNAGINHQRISFDMLDAEVISMLTDINLKGTFLGSKVAITGMLKQGTGMVYNMEGFGSDGRVMQGMSMYGTSKNAVRYFTKSLVKDTWDTPVKVGSISPGMLVTDMLLEPFQTHSEQNKGALKVFNILADPVDRVTPWIVKKILDNQRHGGHIAWLTSGKIAWRFFQSMFYKRKVKGLPEI